MLTNYKDIIEKAGLPTWWDEYGVPRYYKFHPDKCGVYVNIVTLLIIECQSCQERFNAAIAWSNMLPFMEQLRRNTEKGKPNWNLGIQEEPSMGYAPSYGDPPRHHCSGGGETMSSNTIAVTELWKQDGNWQWVRLEDIENEWNKQLQGLKSND